MNPFGPLMGLAALALIGAGFLWVIRAEYGLGWRWWYVFTAGGLALVLLSLVLPSPLASGLFGITGASIVWGSTELKAQAGRAERGWYPSNPHPKPNPPLWRIFSRFRPPQL